MGGSAGAAAAGGPRLQAWQKCDLCMCRIGCQTGMGKPSGFLGKAADWLHTRFLAVAQQHITCSLTTFFCHLLWACIQHQWSHPAGAGDSIVSSSKHAQGCDDGEVEL